MDTRKYLLFARLTLSVISTTQYLLWRYCVWLQRLYRYSQAWPVCCPYLSIMFVMFSLFVIDSLNERTLSRSLDWLPAHRSGCQNINKSELKLTKTMVHKNIWFLLEMILLIRSYFTHTDFTTSFYRRGKQGKNDNKYW